MDARKLATLAGIPEDEKIYDTQALQSIIPYCLKKIRDMCKSEEIESYNLTGSVKRPWFIVTQTQLDNYLAKKKLSMQGSSEKKEDVIMLKRGKGGRFQKA